MQGIRNALALERSMWEASISREFRPFLMLVIVTLTTGTIFYWIVEDWRLLDSLYFCTVTLATIGYGDIAPQTRIGRLFTIGYIFMGVGTLAVFFATVARTTIMRELPGIVAKETAVMGPLAHEHPAPSFEDPQNEKE